jgi:nucleoside-diphosphate-sugar epimerase
MRVLVTGNLGYLGPIVVNRLKELGHYVIGIDAGWYLPTMDLKDTHYLPNEQIFADLRDVEKRLPSDIHAVVHLAGLSNDPMSEIDETLTRRINVMSTIEIVEKYEHATHVIASSASVYGASARNRLSHETDTPAPLTAYAKAKNDIDIWMERNQYVDGYGGYYSTSLRFGTLWGWSPNMRRDIVVNAFCWQAAFNHEIAPNSTARRPMLHVNDAAEVIAYFVGRNLPGVYNVSGENTDVSQIAVKVATATEAALIPCPESLVDNRDYWLDTSKLNNVMRHTFVTLDNAAEIRKVQDAAKALGKDYPTRIQRAKEILTRQ